MGLKPITSVNLEAFLSSGAFTPGSGFFGSIHQAPPKRGFVYYDRLGKFIVPGFQNAATAYFLLEPSFTDNTSPQSFPLLIGGAQTTYFAVGEWDQPGNVQKLYGGSDPPQEIVAIDQATLELGVVDLFAGLFEWEGSNTSPAVIGGWDDTAGGDFVFFETWGFAVRAQARVRHTDSNQYRGMALVDLATGDATLLDSPTHYTSSPAGLFEAPEFNGDSFDLTGLQFVPDDDNQLGAPKGRLMLWSSTVLGDTGPAGARRVYYKVVEFNPFGTPPAPGNVNRVHLRELQFSRIDLIGSELFGTNPNSAGGNLSPGYNFAFDPLSRTIVYIGKPSGLDDEGYVRHSQVPELAAVDQPTPLAEVEDQKTIRYRTSARGDLGDPLAGIDVVWTLERRSTIREALDTAAAGPTSTLANPPVDVIEGANQLTVELEAPAGTFTPLVEGVDYTVVAATGVITWAGAQSPPATSGYFATYKHTATGAQPPHGTLLQASSKTDELGIAETRVQYPDLDPQNTPADLDYLSATVSDD